jgi:pimeloyl-ACP methyl ester carboxylesterase
MKQQQLATVDVRRIPFAESGRYVFIPGRTHNRRPANIILVYGHHSTLERWEPLARELARFGNVWMPDLPGFGGMDEAVLPTYELHAYADHLAKFTSVVAPKGRLLLCGVSFGFAVVCEALRRHPSLLEASRAVVSVGGFIEGSSLRLASWQKLGVLAVAGALRNRRVAATVRSHLLSYPIARSVDLALGLTKRRAGADRSRAARLCAADLELWRANSVTTHWATLRLMMRLQRGTPLDVPCVHIQNPLDPYVCYSSNARSLRSVFRDLDVCLPTLIGHMPSLDSPQSAYEALFDLQCVEVIEAHLNGSRDAPLR